jgi:hypothetical protein
VKSPAQKVRENRKTGTSQVLTWQGARFVLGDIQLLDMGRVTSLSGLSGWSNRNLLVQGADTYRTFEVCRQGWNAVGVRLRLEKNVWWTSASSGGGMLDEKIAIIGAPCSVVLGWGSETREARRKPGFLGERNELWKI